MSTVFLTKGYSSSLISSPENWPIEYKSIVGHVTSKTLSVLDWLMHHTKVERGVISENELASLMYTFKCIMKGL